MSQRYFTRQTRRASSPAVLPSFYILYLPLFPTYVPACLCLCLCLCLPMPMPMLGRFKQAMQTGQVDSNATDASAELASSHTASSIFTESPFFLFLFSPCPQPNQFDPMADVVSKTKALFFFASWQPCWVLATAAVVLSPLRKAANRKRNCTSPARQISHYRQRDSHTPTAISVSYSPGLFFEHPVFSLGDPTQSSNCE